MKQATGIETASFLTRLHCEQVLFVLGFLALCRMAQAVSPAPDGGYLGGNTAEGQTALLSLTTGTFNTAVGWFSLRSNTEGKFNTAIGAGALLANTADQNTATGAGGLLSNTIGFSNTANGAFALFGNTEGYLNTATGSQALFDNTTGSNNTATGVSALYSNTTGGYNTATGAYALFYNTTGEVNTANGVNALYSNTIGNRNTATGAASLSSNTTGAGNTANGAYSLSDNHTGDNNTATGAGALVVNFTGTQNTATGVDALSSNTEGNYNTANGLGALHENTIGNSNTADGINALYNNTTGSLNVALGDRAGCNLTTGSNNIVIGAGVLGDAGDEDTIRIGNGDMAATFIAGIIGATSAGGTPVYIDSAGKLGTITSSKRFKEDIKPMDKASEALLALKPVTFRYKKEIDPAGTSQFGLVAEEVEKVNPDLVVCDKEGRIYTVRYDAVNAMLLNEFLKQHKKVQQLEAAFAQQRNDFEVTIAELKKEIAGVVARSRDQDEKIQKVSAQVELNKTASPKVANK